MLCPFCTSTFNPSIEANIIYAHHLTTKNLLASVQTGCFVCKLIWKEVQTLGNQIVWESSTPSSSSTSSLLRAFKKSSLKSPKPSDPPRLRFRFLTKIQELNFDYRVPGGWKNIVNIQLILSHGYFTENHYSYFQQFEGVDILEVPRTLHTTSTQSSECLQLAKYWIDGCTSSHRKCRSKAEVLPTRLIEVDPIVRLVNGNQLQQDGKYVALSHCKFSYTLWKRQG